MASLRIVIAFAVLAAAHCAADEPELFEGDIVMTDSVRRDVAGVGGYDAQVRGHWPGGIVPYTFSSRFGRDRSERVRKAIRDYTAKTCINFVERTNQRNYVEFIVGSGCYSMIGVQGGRQQISIGNGCTSHGTIIHEMMHAIGFYHEQSRRDRDKYITIYWNNIQKGMEYNFQMYSAGRAVTHGEPYDIKSVMHYRRTAFGGGRVTIASKANPRQQLGQDSGFSEIDIRQINKMYKCDTAITGQPITQPPIATRPPGGCKDDDTRCPMWAKNNQCAVNPQYMLNHCKRSCNSCPGCKDKHTKCAYWAGNNECTKNPNYMLHVCALSCNQC